jgi:hypothetical protein
MLCNMHALHSNIATSVSVGSLNNDRTVMSRTYAWRPLACLPVLKTTAFSNDDKDLPALIWMGIASVDTIPRYEYITLHKVLHDTCFIQCCIRSYVTLLCNTLYAMLYNRVGTPTLPHPFGNREGAVADASAGRGNGRRLYELNLWMWRYGRGQPLHFTVAEAEQRRRRRAAATLKRRLEEHVPADDDSADD